MSDGPYKDVGVQQCEPWRRVCVIGPGLEKPFDETCPGDKSITDLMNLAYAAGRSSRDNLRKAVEKCLEWVSVEINGKKLEVDFLRQALKDDALGGK